MKLNAMNSCRYLVILLGSQLIACSTGEPESGIQDVNGYFHSYAALKEKRLIINYWAEWCHPCLKEIPELNRLYDSFKGDTHTMVLGVNFDGLVKDELRQLINKLDIHFPVLLGDPSNALNFNRPMVLPVTFIVSPQDEINKVLKGPQTHDSIIKILDNNLSQNKQ